MDIIIKAHLQRADSTVEVRRILVTLSSQGNGSGIFGEIVSKVTNTYPGLADKDITLKWKDSDGDLVTMTTDEEMMEAVSSAKNTPLRIFITVDGVKESRTDDFVDIQSDDSQELVLDEGDRRQHEKEDIFDADSVFMGPMGMTFPPPPPPGFGFHDRPPFGRPMGLGGKLRGIRKRGHPDFFNPRGHPGHHFGHHGPHGHHFGHIGPRGHHMGMFGAFGGHGFFEGQHPHPFYSGGMHFGHPFGHHHGDHHRHHGKDGWKASLREAVPVAHRRWAKAFIRNWRVENLKNATSTSSDSDQEVITTEDANVPEAYAKWLEALLPRWHKHLGQETGDKDKEQNVQDKTELKASVPLEFRKWTKWYLTRHFGKKDNPKFRKHGGDHHHGGKLDKHRKKEWKKACKLQTVAATIPLMHRMWAKIFIHDWRQEHKIPDPRNGARGTVSSESEDTEKETRQGDITVPNDYVRWMRKFLSRWHLWKGQIEKQNVEIEKGGMGEFKDTVPKNFRKWVKCFLWRRYGSGAGREADTAYQYQKWLQAFQQRWLCEQQKGGSTDELTLTSGDEEATVQIVDSDTEKTMESSLKKLRLEGDEDGIKKHVQFQTNTESADNEKMAVEGDKGDFEGALFHKQMNAGFRQWAKEALWQWDGRTDPTARQGEGAKSNEQIPPHVYSWMSKMMTKIQMKKMKQELKEARKSVKAVKKAQKHGQF